MARRQSKWRFAVDRGGTFTDVIGCDPNGVFHTEKLFSASPDYDDSSIEGIRRILGIKAGTPLPAGVIEGIRFGTTVATNALLERHGGSVALLITRGFADLLEIAYQTRPDLFSLSIRKPSRLYEMSIEIDERVDQRGAVVRAIDRAGLEGAVREIKAAGFDAVAVLFLHSWRNPEHELACEEVVKGHGITNVFLSHRTMKLIKAVTRGQSTVVDAYLSPVIARYLKSIESETGDIPVEFMESSGGLSHPKVFMGKDALFSGPAGGLVAVARVAGQEGMKGLIGFDMGGTSTDVSRFDGAFERVHEQTIGGIELQKESLYIVSVASGGGSLLWFDGRRMRVGPESAGALPGPACYGFGGPLTVTDANLMTGRIGGAYFPRTFGKDRRSPLDLSVVREKFTQITDEINSALNTSMTPEAVAHGFLSIANELMARAIREISVSRGFDVREYGLLSFGGAGGQHACQLAAMLGMKEVVFHPLSGLMSAYGIGLAHPAKRKAVTLLIDYTSESHGRLVKNFEALEAECSCDAGGQPVNSPVTVTREVDIRPHGADTSITVPYDTFEATRAAFIGEYRRLFGFSPAPEDAPLEVVAVRVEVAEEGRFFNDYRADLPASADADAVPAVARQTIVYREGPVEAPVYLRERVPPGTTLTGPAIIADPYSSFIIDIGYVGSVTESGAIRAARAGEVSDNLHSVSAATSSHNGADPVMLEIFHNLFMGVATEMGHVLQKSAHSVNIKERHDFSCALFNGKGDLVANAPHIPVHLGSMADTVRALIAERGGDMREGDAYLTNNPYRGGSHLPDMTVVCPVFDPSGALLFFTASRGHHADVGGATPGSMPPEAAHIDEEGVLIDSFLLVRRGTIRERELLDLFGGHPFPVRNPAERLNDLKAQIAACRKGEAELRAVIEKYCWSHVERYMVYIQDNGAHAVRSALARFLGGKSEFTAAFADRLDDDTPIKVTFTVKRGAHPPETVKGIVDFSGTGPQHDKDNLNAPLAVTRAAVLYFLRVLTGADIPLNSGCLRPIEIIAPEGSILNPRHPAPVASGNVETSQRVVDVLLGSMGIAAASQGTMNNLLFEIEGGVPYYETIAGGAGGVDGCGGASGVQVHMTNTRITDPEVLEFRHPDLRLQQFSLRKRSGGGGAFPGGEGVVREIAFLKPARVSIISERRRYGPYGMAGGGAGEKGKNLLKKANGETVKLPHRTVLEVAGGDSICIETPGGGGYGRPDK